MVRFLLTNGWQCQKYKKIMMQAMARFFIGGEAFSTILKSNKAVGSILRVEVSLGNLLTELMGCSAVKAREIQDGTVMAAVRAYGAAVCLERRLILYMISERGHFIIWRFFYQFI